jgi:hypothetical protein
MAVTAGPVKTAFANGHCTCSKISICEGAKAGTHLSLMRSLCIRQPGVATPLIGYRSLEF